MLWRDEIKIPHNHLPFSVRNFFLFAKPKSGGCVLFCSPAHFLLTFLHRHSHQLIIIININITVIVVCCFVIARHHCLVKLLKMITETKTMPTPSIAMILATIKWCQLNHPKKGLIGLNLNWWCVIYENDVIKPFWKLERLRFCSLNRMRLARTQIRFEYCKNVASQPSQNNKSPQEINEQKQARRESEMGDSSNRYQYSNGIIVGKNFFLSRFCGKKATTKENICF